MGLFSQNVGLINQVKQAKVIITKMVRLTKMEIVKEKIRLLLYAIIAFVSRENVQSHKKETCHHRIRDTVYGNKKDLLQYTLLGNPGPRLYFSKPWLYHDISTGLIQYQDYSANKQETYCSTCTRDIRKTGSLRDFKHKGYFRTIASD
jgi:hypothetical protein